MPPVLNSVKRQKCQINRNIDPLVKNKQTAAAGGGEGEIDFVKEKKGYLWNGMGHELRHKERILNLNSLTCSLAFCFRDFVRDCELLMRVALTFLDLAVGDDWR